LRTAQIERRTNFVYACDGTPSRDYQLGLTKTYSNKLVNYMHKENYPIAFLS